MERWPKEELVKLISDIGRSINANNGRCACIEDTLIKAQALALDYLLLIDPPRPEDCLDCGMCESCIDRSIAASEEHAA